MISLILFLTMIIGTQGFAKLPNGDGSRGGGTAGSLRRAVSDWIAGGALKNTVVETYGPIEDWDVSEVTNMKYVFYGSGSSASTFGSFNADLSKWNTGAVTTMNAMFIMASAFNQDVSNWNTGAVIDMAFMFYGASLFNQDVSNWNTGAVIDMAYMFNSALVFNQDVSKWNTGAVTQMKGMFYYAWAFNSDVSNWNTSAVTTMKNMFFNSGFTRTLCGGTWESLPGITNAFDNLGTSTARLGCCSPGTYMAQPNLHPFSEATACAACPIGQYGSAVEDDITSCTACAAVTDGTCTACTSALAGSCTAVKCVAGRSSMDNDANNGCEVATLPNGDESYSATGNTRSLRRVVSDWIAGGAFKSTVVATYGPIEDWDVSEVTNMKNVFYGWQLASTFGSFNADLSKWDVSRVTTMYESKCTLSPSMWPRLPLLCSCEYTTTRVSSDHNSHTFCYFVFVLLKRYLCCCLWWVGLSFLCCFFVAPLLQCFFSHLRSIRTCPPGTRGR
jgi:surface protein